MYIIHNGWFTCTRGTVWTVCVRARCGLRERERDGVRDLKLARGVITRLRGALVQVVCARLVGSNFVLPTGGVEASNIFIEVYTCISSSYLPHKILNFHDTVSSCTTK